MVNYARLRKYIVAAFFTLLATVVYAQDDASAKKYTTDFSLEVSAEDRLYLFNPLYNGQERNYLSIAVQPEYLIESKSGKHSFKINLFGRLDQYDENRTHADVRELYYQYVASKWEFSVGLKKVYWGVTEAIHLVDIINQTDQVESFDGEQKLGQPMAHFSYLSNIGTFDLFYLPYARKRQFPGKNGRLRFPALNGHIVERDDFEVDSDIEEFHPSAAIRWSHYFGPVDIGVSNFYGVGREPLFTGLGTANPSFFYPIINQTGFDIQATTGAFLWKLESIYRYAKQQDFTALAVGAEYTFSNIKNKGIDVGVIAEYMYDERGDLAISNMDNDVFMGARLAFNDVQSTEFLAGAIVDIDKSTTFYSVEASRRLWNSWKVEVEARFFQDVSTRDFAYFFRDDDFVQLKLSKFF